MTEPRPTLMWFRRDLRVSDNIALSEAAARGGPVVPVYIFDEGAGRAPGAAARWWLDKSLRALADSLQALGSRLILRQGDTSKVLDELVEEAGAEAVLWSRTFEPLAEAQDARLVAHLAEHGVAGEGFSGRLLIEPGMVRTQGGKPFGVFSPFWRAAEAALHPDAPLKSPRSLKAPGKWPKSLDVDKLALHPSKPDWSGGFSDWTPGEKGAHATLKAFLDARLKAYPQDRDRPAVNGSSQLSPHLSWGEISPRQVFCAVRDRKDGHGAQAEKFLLELGWRDFDYGLLDQQPALDDKPFKPAAPTPKWRRSAADLKAWTRGRTGYPIVDAGMRQLWTLGWMHNRVRLITSSFLVKHLLIDWREGERWFWDCLIDADIANNPANWQWIGGSGADAQPFFRIFNPMLQGQKFDPDGDYVRQWVPELAKLEKRWIHTPWQAPADALAKAKFVLGETYPRPIVEHAAARERALTALRSAHDAKSAQAA